MKLGMDGRFHSLWCLWALNFILGLWLNPTVSLFPRIAQERLLPTVTNTRVS